MNGSPLQEIIGGNIYLSNMDSVYQRSVWTPRVTKLIEVDLRSEGSEVRSLSCSSKKDKTESSPITNSNKKISKKIPFQQLKRPIEENKHEIYLNKVPSYISVSESNSKFSMSREKESVFGMKSRNNPNLKMLTDK